MKTSAHNPPPLAWVDSFVDSTSRALDQQIFYTLEPTVNPLVFTIRLRWEQGVSGKLVMGVWNLLQIWIHKNNCETYGKVNTGSTSLAAHIVTKMRLGPPKDENPFGIRR
jgi:hypothetical protein